jgi:competence protein ComEC
MRSLGLLAAVLLAGCPAPQAGTSSRRTHPTRGGRPKGPPPTQITQTPGAPRVTWDRVKSPEDVPATPPLAGTYRIHLIDVGTGLAIFVQGNDFTMLFDGGTNDPGEKPLRVVDYLETALGPSGDDLCVDKGAPPPTSRKHLDHVVLSHPHLDHGSALDLVVHCFDVGDVWDSGRVNQAAFYRDFLEAVSHSTARYHTAADVPTDHIVGVKGSEIHIANWQRFSEDDTVHLGEGARFTILHADGKPKPDPNQNSIVLAVDLGGAHLLLVGDAESGDREDPDNDPGDIEEFLLDHHAAQLRSDILQVGHHGSKTSSRRKFVAAVAPKLALVSSGPKKYATVTLPDPEIIDELRDLGAQVLRTDEHDDGCPFPRRIGGDKGPGGCDSYIITIQK